MPKTEEVSQEAPAIVDPGELSTEQLLSGLQNDASSSETEESLEAKEESGETEDSDASDSVGDDEDEDDDLEELDLDGQESSTLGVDDLADEGIVEALKDDPQALKRYQQQVKGIEKLQLQVADYRDKAEYVDSLEAALDQRELAPQVICNIIAAQCARHNWDVASFCEYVADLQPTIQVEALRVESGTGQTALEKRLEAVEAELQQAKKMQETDRFIRDKGALIAKKVAQENLGFKVSNGQIKKAILDHPNLTPVEAVEFCYRKQIRDHYSVAKSNASKVRGHEVPQSQKGVGKKVENIDPGSMTTEAYLKHLAQQV